MVATSRQYLDGTACLETTFTVDDGEVVLLDVMPVGDDRADVVRRLTCTRGSVRIRHDWVVRTDYGRVRPWVSREQAHGDEVVVAVAGPDKLVLRGPHLPHGHDGHHSDEFEMTAGDEVTFSTTWVRSWRDIPRPLGFDERIDATTARQREWSARSPEDVPHADMVRRSLLTLLLMTHAETGGDRRGADHVAAGGLRWRAQLGLPLLLAARRGPDARVAARRRLRAGSAALAQLAAEGRRRRPRRPADHVHRRRWPPAARARGAAPGRLCATAGPVRIGNGAVSQRQNDVLGEVMVALELAREAGLEETHNSWSLQRALVDELAEHWDEPDNGLWEIRGPQRHFTHSRVMVWVAFDRAVKAVERHGLDGPVERWRELRDRVREEILDKGFDHERGTFTQHYDTTAVDASLLTIPLVGFLPGNDPRVLGTIDAVIADLDDGGLLLRYRTETGVDGISGDETPFLACSFWLVSALAKAGRRDRATELMDRLCGLANDVGLLSEEYDTRHGRMAGNFPQAFSHLTLVQAALALR